MSESREQAETLLWKAGVAGEFPVPLERIARHLNFTSLAFNGDPSISGAIKYGDRKIYVNKSEPVQRQRFTLAHEIAHAVLHANEDLIDYRVNFDAPKDKKEIEANSFAANLLMPEAAFREVYQSRNGSLPRIAKYFGVSEVAAKYRAEYLGLL